MKATGMVRKIDLLGRIVLPVELRRTLDFELKDPIEIFVDDDTIILRKYQPQCTLCGSMENIIYFKGKSVCKRCISEL